MLFNKTQDILQLQPGCVITSSKYDTGTEGTEESLFSERYQRIEDNVGKCDGTYFGHSEINIINIGKVFHTEKGPSLSAALKGTDLSIAFQDSNVTIFYL